MIEVNTSKAPRFEPSPEKSRRRQRIEELRRPRPEPFGGVSVATLEEMRREALEFHANMASFEGDSQ